MIANDQNLEEVSVKKKNTMFKLEREIRALLGVLSIDEIIINQKLTAQAERVLFLIRSILSGGHYAKTA